MTESMLLVAVVYYLGAFVLSIAICHFLPATISENGVFQFILVFPNVGFMGILLSLAILGPGSLFYVILFNMPFYLLAFTLGIYLITQGRTEEFKYRTLLTPGLIASVIGLGLFLVGYTIPAPASTLLDWIGMMTTPLAMLVVGALLSTLPISCLAGDWRVAVITAFRLVILPVIAFFVLLSFVHDKLLVEVAVLLIAMPAASNTVLFSEEYDVEATLASQGVFLSTMLCLITIPLIELLFFKKLV
jgi:predicted permease